MSDVFITTDATCDTFAQVKLWEVQYGNVSIIVQGCVPT